MTAPSVDAALAQARAAGMDRLDAAVLLGHAMGRPRTWLLAHGDAVLSPREASDWSCFVGRRADGEPLAYVIGEKEFHGLSFQVDRRVLVPRPETELLVSWALEIVDRLGTAAEEDAPRIVDLGTGSGAIAVAVKAKRPQAVVGASDVEAQALDVARANATRLGTPIEFRHGSWWEPWSGDRFDIALANPPYIAEDDPHLPALAAEPLTALVAGRDGGDAWRAIVATAASHLKPGGWLLLEHGFDQAAAVRSSLRRAGFAECSSRSDLAGIERCTGGRLVGLGLRPRSNRPGSPG